MTHENERVPEGAIPVLVGSRLYLAARRKAHLLVVNDWLRFSFRRRKHQHVLQTWHGTMLKHLALGRPRVSLRTRLAVHREARRWSFLLSQNPHSSAQFRKNYAFSGELIESGYPRDDRLARAVIDGRVHPIHSRAARAIFGLPETGIVLAYMPTWRDRNTAPDQLLDTQKLADHLGDEVTVLVRGHTRAGQLTSLHPRVIDVSKHDDINDVFLASDLIVTDYSSVMFDAAVARLPIVFYTPDLAQYSQTERGFTFDFVREAPGPIVKDYAALAEVLSDFVAAEKQATWLQEYQERADSWRKKFVPWDDGHAAERVVEKLNQKGLL